MQIPLALKKGDTVAIVSTARKITKLELQPAIELLKSWGLNVKVGKTIGAQDHQYAGNDTLRTADFQTALNDKKVNAIWCARGGYGTIRMVDGINFSGFLNNPKWIIGYSDVTILHSHIHNLGVATIHGQMCLEIEKRTQAARNTLKEILFGNFNNLSYILNDSYNRKGNAQGVLIGGNLSVLYSTIGSQTEYISEGKILFIEDLDEMLYHIDRMMMNLKRSGVLKGLAGLIVGGMSDMRDNTIPFGKTAIQIIGDAVSEYKYPVCFDFPAGHIEDNRALVIGAEIELIVDEVSATINYKL
ncbi:peptidase S66 [Patiriisocius marinistellae]|uniref:Peptidase S66 n=1 Tax=Patiriisocius marinistellae TaxID=2494560 RepID=A0A5J4FYF2_9FLAO|nr:LD-carboxypeptidase [Patiriisocius marinistellae]GEQ85065.1 peptidase S66 [Patiriisocius marinistellae]